MVKTDIAFLDKQIKKLINADSFDQSLYQDIIQRGIYIKRKSNLLILAESSQFTPLSELKLTLDEMMTGLYNIEKDAVYLINLSQSVKTTDIIACLDLLQRILLENELTAVHLRLESDAGAVVFRVLFELTDGQKSSGELTLEVFS